MALPAEYNASVLYGDTLAFQVNYAQSNGTPIDITNSSVEFEVRAKTTDELPELKLEVGSGITKTNASQGQFEVVISRAQVLQLGQQGRDKKYEHFVKVITGGVHDSILYGELLIKGGYGS